MPSCFAFYFLIFSVVFTNFNLAFGIGLWLEATITSNSVCQASFTSACIPSLGLAWGSVAAQFLLGILVFIFDWMFVRSYME